jgi:hypothetical protein
MEFGRNSARATFIFEVGADFRESFEIQANGIPVNLTGSTFVFEIRRIANSETPVDTGTITVSGSTVTIFYSAADIADLESGVSEAERNSIYHGRLLWTDAAGFKRRPITALILVSAGHA